MMDERCRPEEPRVVPSTRRSFQGNQGMLGNPLLAAFSLQCAMPSRTFVLLYRQYSPVVLLLCEAARGVAVKNTQVGGELAS